MTSNYLKLMCFTVVIGLTSCKTEQKEESAMNANVLLQEWTGDFQGTPAFDKMSVDNIKEAMEVGMKENLVEIDSIANQTTQPTFENTILGMERAGQTLNRVFTYYGILSRNMSSPEFRKIQSELAPKLSEFQSKITQNEKLFNRIKTIYEASKKTPLDADQQRVVDLIYQQFAMNGAELNAEKKKRYAESHKEFSRRYTKLSNNVLHDEENYVTYLTKDQLGG